MTSNIKYWRGEEELNKDAKFLASQKNEFAEPLPLDEVFAEDGFELKSNRRDFLKFFGFSVTAVALAACYRAPVRHAVPYLVKPEEVTPGVADYYSSTCGACSTGCGIEVKVREGRPIKVDGSPRSPISKGGICAVGAGSILSLYDIERLANPRVNGAEVADWSKVDSDIVAKLDAIEKAGERIVILSNSIHSPSALKAIEDFKKKYTKTEHITYDAVSYSGIIDSHVKDFGKRVVPSYKFESAQVIVSFGADFLGTWISPVEFTKGYVANRIPSADKTMSTHIQFESNLSLTGTNADYRFPIKASDNAAVLTKLYNAVAQMAGAKQIPVTKQKDVAGNGVAQAAKLLWENKGKSLVISGSNETEIQQVVNGLNMLLGNYGTTIDLDNASNQYKGIDSESLGVLKDLNDGKVGAILFYHTNPVYNSADSKAWSAGIKKAKLSVSFASSVDETADLCNFVCPDHHYLESWGDAEPKVGQYHFVQPTIAPVFNTRQAPVSLLAWAGALPSAEKDVFADNQILSQKYQTSPYYTYVKNQWLERLEGDKNAAFNKLLHDGVWIAEAKTAAVPSYGTDITSLAGSLDAWSKAGAVDLVLYEKVGVRDGSQGNNPWMHELPDPVTKVCWDNYVTLPKALAESKGINNGDTVNIEANGYKLNNVPALIQPGQANNTIGMALGYGRTMAGKVGGHVIKGYDVLGHNAYGFFKHTGTSRSFVVQGVTVTKGDENYSLAQTQTHHSIEGRDHVRETNYAAWKKNPKAGNDKPKAHMYSIWEKREYRKDGSPNHLWAMAIDLNACTGCGSCIVSCSIENNVPVVGRDEIKLRREMHWIRIDRYYSFANNGTVINKESDQYEGNFVTKEKTIAKMDAADKDKQFAHWENVKVVHQPMMCQHCAQAPCETVCPVLATTHSSEGLNQMTYNRCIGTKYCGNNCPYKVRRYNWFRYNDNDQFDFHFNNKLGKTVINPDVTVRTRGVMEKCSFCVQRIQEGKLKAKRENRTVKDGDIKTACMKACPANAIVFGDLHDKDSEVSKLYRNERSFHVLEELNVQSSVAYLTKVRNTENV